MSEVNCLYCGFNRGNSNSQVCSQCGKPFVSIPDCSCPGCKSLYIIGQNFCKNCGHKLPMVPNLPVQIEDKNSTFEINSPYFKKCKCGKIARGKYCGFCGTLLEANTPPGNRNSKEFASGLILNNTNKFITQPTIPKWKQKKEEQEKKEREERVLIEKEFKKKQEQERREKERLEQELLEKERLEKEKKKKEEQERFERERLINEKEEKERLERELKQKEQQEKKIKQEQERLNEELERERLQKEQNQILLLEQQEKLKELEKHKLEIEEYKKLQYEKQEQDKELAETLKKKKEEILIKRQKRLSADGSFPYTILPTSSSLLRSATPQLNQISISPANNNPSFTNNTQPITVATAAKKSGRSRFSVYKNSSLKRHSTELGVNIDNGIVVSEKLNKHLDTVLGSIKLLTESLGLAEEDILNLLTSIELKYKPPKYPSQPLEQSGRFLMQLAKFEIQEFLTSEERLAKIIRVQSVVRGWLVRKRLSKFIDKEYRGKVLKRNKVYIDLLKTEKAYIDDLTLLINQYLIPLRVKDHVLKPKQIQTLFCNIESILTAHQNHYRRLEFLKQKWPFIDGISSAFYGLTSSLKDYGQYVVNFKTADDTLSQLINESKPFGNFLQETAIRLNEVRDLNSFLSLPLNYISKYAVLLERLTVCTPPDYEDASKIANVSAIMENARAFIEQALYDGKNLARLRNVQEKLVDYKSTLEKRGRKFFSEQSFIEYDLKRKKSSKAERVIILFDDMCLITKSMHKEKLKFMFQFDYDNLEVENVPDTINLKLAIDLKYNNSTAIRVIAKNSKEKLEWIELIKSLIAKKAQKKFFGVPLNILLNKELSTKAGIPSFLNKCFTHLENVALDLEGLFRISPPIEQVKSCRLELDSGNLDLDFKSINPHTVAALIKLFFRELPEPLFTYELYEPLVKNERENFSETSRQQKRLAFIKQIPSANYALLKYLIQFLAKVSARSSFNKMTPANLSIIFGPCLIKPKFESIETSLEVPFCNEIIQYLILHPIN